MGPSSSEGSAVAPMVLSLAIPNNLVLTMSSLIGATLATRMMQNLETLHYYVLHTLFPLPGYLDDQHSEFLQSWMAYLDFKATFFPPRRILYLVQNSVSPSVGHNLVNIHSFLRFILVSYSLILLDCFDI